MTEMTVDSDSNEKIVKSKPQQFKTSKKGDTFTQESVTPHLLNLMFNEPFFSRVIRGVNVYVSETDVPTAGVNVKDTDVYMVMNPNFCSGLTPMTMKGLLKHECFHLAFDHCTTRRLEPHAVANIAADLAINSDIPRNEMKPDWLYPGVCPPWMVGQKTGALIASFPLHKSSEWYFARIMEDPECVKECKAMGEGNGMDSHAGWGEMSDEERAIARAKIREAIEEAAKTCDKDGRWGSVSASMRQKIREMLTNEVNWKEVLKQFCGHSKRGLRTTTWTSINVVHIHEEHGPLSTGSKRGYTSSIAVYLDQSGSVSDKEIALAFGEFNSLAKRTEFTSYHFDTEVDEKSKIVWNKRNSSTLGHRTRCGGTCFDAPTNHLKKHPCFDGGIVVTDGCAPKPGPSKQKRCWLLTPGNKLAFVPDPNDVVVYMKWPKGSKNAEL